MSRRRWGGRVLVKEPLHTGLMQPGSLIFLSTGISDCYRPSSRSPPDRPPELRGLLVGLFGVVDLAAASPADLNALVLPASPARDPDTLLVFGAADAAASPGMGLSSHCAASQHRLPSSLPLCTAPPLLLASSSSASPPFVLALFTLHTHTSSCRRPLPRKDAVVSSPRIRNYN